MATKIIGKLALVLFGVAIGGAIATFLWVQFDRSSRRTQLDRALNGELPIDPPWLGRPLAACTASNDREQAQDAAMLAAAKAFAGGKSSVGLSYVVSWFAWHRGVNERLNRCPPAATDVAALGPILDAAGWPQANVSRNDLELAERLPPSQVRATGLAHIAFLRWKPPADAAGFDSRPYARMMLAEQGGLAQPWRSAALAGIGGGTKLGTSAAYLAVALAPGEALPRVSRLFGEALDAALKRPARAYADGGERPAIGVRDGDRLLELAYALGRGGPAADRFAAPLRRALDQDWAYPAPPFGLLAGGRVELCWVAAHIGGEPAAAASSKAYCRPKPKHT